MADSKKRHVVSFEKMSGHPDLAAAFAWPERSTASSPPCFEHPAMTAAAATAAAAMRIVLLSICFIFLSSFVAARAR